ncbi:hypothetical protein D3C72_1811090 [compost metagenome]
MAVAVDVDELEVRVAEIDVQGRGKRSEGLPSFGIVVFVQAGGGAFHDYDVGLPVAGKVHEVRAGI